MKYFVYKYSSKFTVSLLSLFIFISCVQKHKFDKYHQQLSDKKMLQVLPDVFLMEAYVNEKYKVTNNDSIVAVKQTFYPEIFAHHKIDSTDFYETLDYFQSNPSKFSDLLIKLDSVLQKIKPLDTTKTAEIKPPENVEKLLNYRGRADQISTAFDKDSQLIKKIKYRREQNSK